MTMTLNRSLPMLRNDLYRPWFVGETDWGVEFITGDFKDVAIQIEKLEFSETNKGSVDISYHIVHRPEHLKDLNSNDPLFSNTLELVINDILKEAIQIHEQTRDNSTEKPST